MGKVVEFCRYPKSVIIFILFLSSILLIPITGLADADLEKEIQAGLEKSKNLIAAIDSKNLSGTSITSDINQLKTEADNIRITQLLLDERFKLREEKVKTLGSKALDRHQAMADGYRSGLSEYLTLVDSLSVEGSNQLILGKLKTLLDKIVPKKKRPIVGSLPYKHLNYPSKQPSSAGTITPAYLGGNKTVTSEDTKTTDEAPLTNDIAMLAQSLNWSPVSIYEYVKNNMETEWYWGCMKGAEETLRQKSGNDCDQATLLAALLRASGFPTRYVRGVIQFFPDIARAKHLTGIEDAAKIAEFFQDAGIPFNPVISGGTISNFQIEHIWVESQIPYANYRGTIIDEHGKTWLGLDTSIKVKGYTYNNAKDIYQEPGISSRLSGIRDEYLSAVRTETPLEYLQSSINSELGTLSSSLSYTNYLQTKTLNPEVLNILPASMQFTLIKATNEYTAISDELIHQVKIIASDSNKKELVNITQPLYNLSNQQIAVSYEAETVEDQEIIDSYGGLDNTPAYLVHLRPVLKVNGERIAVGTDGLPMGGEYSLTIDLISPNGTESITNAHLVGNLSVIGITAERAVVAAAEGEEKDAERLLYEAANHYIDRWNQAEEELASLLHLSLAKPVPTVVTVGGVIDVTYLLDMPHDFTWKGDFIDANIRRVEAVATDVTKAITFMQLSSLQGSVLEHKIFEDDFEVESISSAKLLQIANAGQPSGNKVLTIDSSNISALLPSLAIDDDIKDDISNSVNQNYVIRIPQSEIAFMDWTGIGYIKENASTAESGWMLSGSIAGGMTAVSPDKWSSKNNEDVMSNPYDDNPKNVYITSPEDETTVSTPVVVVKGIVLDPDAVVLVNGASTEVDGTMFYTAVTLTSGNNLITAVATNKDGTATSDSIALKYKIPVKIAITYPFDGADLAVSPIYIEGFVTDPDATVYVMGAKAQVSSDGFFIATDISLTEGSNQIVASAMNTDGDLDSQTITVNYHGVQPLPSLEVAITTPIAGTTINKPFTTVVGTVTSSADEVWVMVNGMPAVIYENQFVVNNIELADGNNRIIVNAMDSNGAISRTEIMLTGETEVPYVGLRANITSGTLPLNSNFTVNTININAVIEYRLDFGDGSVPYNGATLDDVVHSYPTEGIFYPTLTVTDSTGNVYIDSIALTVLTKLKLNTVLTMKWNEMKAKLANQDIEGALGYFISFSQDRYREILNALSPELSQMVQDMRDIEMIYAANNMAKYRIRANEVYGGQNLEITYYIYFEVNEYGEWLIRLF